MSRVSVGVVGRIVHVWVGLFSGPVHNAGLSAPLTT